MPEPIHSVTGTHLQSETHAMDIKRLLTSLSNRILTQFAIVIAVVLVLIAFNFGSIYPFYAENQLTSTGLIINAAIFALFLLGI